MVPTTEETGYDLCYILLNVNFYYYPEIIKQSAYLAFICSSFICMWLPFFFLPLHYVLRFSNVYTHIYKHYHRRS